MRRRGQKSLETTLYYTAKEQHTGLEQQEMITSDVDAHRMMQASFKSPTLPSESRSLQSSASQ